MKNVRPAAQAGAQVLYDEVRANVAKIGKKTGNLARSIYQAYSEDNSTKGSATYHVSYNASKAPHGNLVEYGHIQTRKVYLGRDGNWYTSKTLLPEPKQVGARPYIRPAFDAKSKRAVEAARDAFVDGMKQVTG
ncbi:MAG: HK97 gp10 family phage protein [Methylibium sp.]|nr:HK97 gp10 family phage protein [Methylibium sp.]